MTLIIRYLGISFAIGTRIVLEANGKRNFILAMNSGKTDSKYAETPLK